MNKLRRYPLITFISVIAASLNVNMAQSTIASSDRYDYSWFSSDHGPLISCYSLVALLDGSYQLDRYLTVNPGQNAQHLTGYETVGSGYHGLTEQLIKTASLAPEFIPFYHESYQLDGQYHISGGQLIQGTIPYQHQLNHWHMGYCEDLSAQTALAEESLQEGEPLAGDSDSWSVTEVTRRPKEPDKQGKPQSDTIQIPGKTTPLMLLTRSHPGDYENVFDPLYRQKIALPMSNIDYTMYSSDHIKKLACLLLTSTAATTAASAALFAGVTATLLPAIVPVGLIGMAVSLWYMSDGWQTPADRAVNQLRRLEDRSQDNQTLLSDLRRQEWNHRMELREDFSLNDNQHDLTAIMDAYREKRRQHKQELEIIEKRLTTLQTGQQERLAQLDQRKSLDQRYREQELDIEKHRSIIHSLEERTFRAKTEILEHLPHAPESDATTSREQLLQKWDETNKTLSALMHEQAALQRERDGLLSRTHLELALAEHAEAIVIAGQKVVAKKQKFEQDYGKALTILEMLHETREKIEVLDQETKNIEKRVARTKIDARLMALVTAYSRYNRTPRMLYVTRRHPSS